MSTNWSCYLGYWIFFVFWKWRRITLLQSLHRQKKDPSSSQPHLDLQEKPTFQIVQNPHFTVHEVDLVKICHGDVREIFFAYRVYFLNLGKRKHRMFPPSSTVYISAVQSYEDFHPPKSLKWKTIQQARDPEETQIHPFFPPSWRISARWDGSMLFLSGQQGNRGKVPFGLRVK